MGPFRLSRNDLARAQSIMGELLDQGCPLAVIRRRAERILMKSDPESYRYAFWRLILALIVAESPHSSRAGREVPVAVA